MVGLQKQYNRDNKNVQRFTVSNKQIYDNTVNIEKLKLFFILYFKLILKYNTFRFAKIFTYFFSSFILFKSFFQMIIEKSNF